MLLGLELVLLVVAKWREEEGRKGEKRREKEENVATLERGAELHDRFSTLTDRMLVDFSLAQDQRQAAFDIFTRDPQWILVFTSTDTRYPMVMLMPMSKLGGGIRQVW